MKAASVAQRCWFEGKLSKSEIKKMRDKFNKTGKLPPHLMKLAKLMDKHTEVRNIVVPGLEWMSKLGEGKLKEGPRDFIHHSEAKFLKVWKSHANKAQKLLKKFKWQVEKYTREGSLKGCWLTTAVSQPIPLGSSI